MAFLPKKFAGAQKHSRPHFPANDIGPLVGQHRQIAPRLDPPAHRRADHRFGSWPDNQRLLQLCVRIGDQFAIAVGDQTVMRNHRHFLGKAIDMIGFFFKE